MDGELHKLEFDGGHEVNVEPVKMGRGRSMVSSNGHHDMIDMPNPKKDENTQRNTRDTPADVNMELAVFVDK